MSKMKLMYDVINTMKEKDLITGVFKAEVKKDQIKIIGFNNQFEKNLANGETKCKISTEIDCNDKKFKHESQTEFTSQGCQGKMHRGFMQHMQHMHHHHQPSDQNYEDIRCGGIKEKLTKLAFVLNVFNQIKVDEKEDKSIVLSLNLNEIPEDIKKVFQERMSQRTMSEHHQHHGFMKELSTLKDPKIELNLCITKNKEVEKIMLTVEGKQIDELNENHDMNLFAELSLAQLRK